MDTAIKSDQAFNHVNVGSPPFNVNPVLELIH